MSNLDTKLTNIKTTLIKYGNVNYFIIFHIIQSKFYMMHFETNVITYSGKNVHHSLNVRIYVIV